MKANVLIYISYKYISKQSTEEIHHSSFPALNFAIQLSWTFTLFLHCEQRISMPHRKNRLHLRHSFHNNNNNNLSSLSHFPGEPELAGVYWSKRWWRWWWQLDYWSYKSCKAPVISSPPTNQHPVFYRPDALPVNQLCQSTEWKNIKFHGLAYPKLTWACSNFVSDH